MSKGDKLRVTGTATFGPRTDDTDAETLFDLDFDDLAATGVFNSRDAAFEIKGNKYTPPVREKKEAEPEGAREKTKPNEKKAN